MSFGVIKITNLDLSELHEQLRRSTGHGHDFLQHVVLMEIGRE